MRIGDLARRTGASVRSLRYYEEQGLLASERTPSGQRSYEEGAVDRVVFLQRLYAAGLSSRTILELLPCAYDPSTRTSDAAFDRLRAERERVDRQIADLVGTREALDHMIEANRRHRDSLPVPV